MATNAHTIRGQGVSYAYAQDVGSRANQEDRCLVHEMTTSDGRSAVLALIADGIGGHRQGETASQMATEKVPEHFAGQEPTSDEVGRALRSAVEQTGRDIYEASLLDASREAMGCTCTATLIIDTRLYLAHVGDTRAYLLRRDQLSQLTTDHTWGEEAIRAGFPVEDIRRHPNRGVLKRYLGINPTVEVDTGYQLVNGNGGQAGDTLESPLALAAGDVLMLCSDGVADVLEPASIREALRLGDPGRAATALVQAALQAGATDNVSVVTLRLAGGKTLGPWWWPAGH